ncbi:MAG: PhnD/SsuA/transferrin family substrate-binding protein, partial [Clostridiales bacterium]|nr:PhnD/SsuA/transferrin family substrate-binding protein [Clostridiales bacterium]
DHFVAFLAEKTGKTVVQNVVEHESSAIIEMRDHKLDIGSFAAGTTCYAVNLAGYVPYAVKGTSAGPQSYRLGVVVAKNNYDSGRFTTILDMKGAYVAHATATSSSGHIAPLALLPQEGITPGVDYEIHFSGSHEASIYGVLGKKVVLGEDGKAIVKPDGTNELEDTEPYDFGCVAAHSSEFDRMVRAGKIKAEDFEFIWESGLFLTSSFGWAYDLHPDLIAKIKAAFDEYLFSEDMITVFGEVDGLPVDRFSPISYLRDYSVTRTMAQAVGTTFDEAGLLELIDSEANK